MIWFYIGPIVSAASLWCAQGLQVAQKETQIRLLEGRLRQTDMTGSAQNHMILDALREKAECIPELQALIHNVQQGGVIVINTSAFSDPSVIQNTKINKQDQINSAIPFAVFPW